MRIQYTGVGHERHLSAADFKTIGADGAKKTVWVRANNDVHEIPDVAGQWLLDNEPKEWKQVEDEPDDVSGDLALGEVDNQLDVTGDPTAASSAAAPPTTGTASRRAVRDNPQA